MLKAKAEAAFWRKGLRVMQRQVVVATRRFEAAGRLFDGQQVRLQRELDRAPGIAAWAVEQKMHRAEIRFREARLAWELVQQKCLCAELCMQEALCAQKDAKIAHLLKRIRMYRKR